MTAPRPISQVRMDTRVPAAAPARATPSNRKRVSNPNSTVATMRAEGLPALFISAIQTHSPMLISPMNTEPTTTTVCRLCNCVGVSEGWALCRLSRSPPIVTRPTIRLSALTTAPAYISRTAITTEAGGSECTGSGIRPADGYCWTMTAPRGRFHERATRTERGCRGLWRPEPSRAARLLLARYPYRAGSPQQGPHHLAALVEQMPAPAHAAGLDHGQATAALRGEVGVPQYRDPVARVGHHAHHERSLGEQPQPHAVLTDDRARGRNAVPHRVGQQFGHDQLGHVGELFHAPQAQRDPGEVAAGFHRFRIRAERACRRGLLGGRSRITEQ